MLRLDTLNYKVKGMHLTVETLKSKRLINIIGTFKKKSFPIHFKRVQRHAILNF